MAVEVRPPRAGWIEFSDQFIERADESVDVWGLALHDALRSAGLEDGERYYVRLTVIEILDAEDLNMGARRATREGRAS